MQLLRTSLALMALVALVTPCTHAEEHHHEMPGVELCATDHESCHTCSEESCTDSPEAAWIISPLAIPVPPFRVLCELKPKHEFFVVISHPPGELARLQTIQLRI